MMSALFIYQSGVGRPRNWKRKALPRSKPINVITKINISCDCVLEHVEVWGSSIQNEFQTWVGILLSCFIITYDYSLAAGGAASSAELTLGTWHSKRIFNIISQTQCKAVHPTTRTAPFTFILATESS